MPPKITAFAVPKAPGEKKRKGRYVKKGRQVDAPSRQAVEELLEGRSRRRDELIEYLHLVQDKFGSLSHGHLAALAEAMRLSLAEIYEVASFYHNFDIVADGQKAPPAITLRVCDGLSCEMAGAADLFRQLTEKYGANMRLAHGACMGRCDQAPVLRLKDRYVGAASLEDADGLIAAEKSDRPLPLPVFQSYANYQSAGGYEILRKLRRQELTTSDMIARIEQSGHRGLGGAGFPHAIKLKSVRSVPGPRYMAVNADESEPGTFKDRHYLNREPHAFLEGMLIAADLVETSQIYIFLRDEYPDTAAILKSELQILKSEDLLDGVNVILRRGAGSYICGEESAMLESLEGKRALPRHKPPFPAHVGLFGQPTLINNVETLYWLPQILGKGPDWYKDGGRAGSTGFRSFSVSGHVRKPGVYLVPAGISAKEIIDEFCGGMKAGHQFRAYLPGGASGGLLPANMADIPLDFGSLEKHGCFIGSAALIVLSDQDDMKSVGLNLMRFFEDESCGQCTPCRLGTEKARGLMVREKWDAALLEDLSAVMADASICGLGQAAPNVLRSILKYFPEDVT